MEFPFRTFLTFPCGRTATATTALLFVAAALVSMARTGPFDMIFPAVTLVGVVGFMFAVGLALDRFWTVALALILALPLLGALYFVGLHVVAGRGAAPAAILLACAAALGWWSASGYRRLAQSVPGAAGDTRPRE